MRQKLHIFPETAGMRLARLWRIFTYEPNGCGRPQMTSRLSKDELTQQAYALAVSGFTILPSQADTNLLKELRSCADEALARAAEVEHSSGKLNATNGSAYYKANRCLYCWGDAPLRWLEHENTRALAELTLGEHLLWDMSVLSALPTPSNETRATTSWHRDFNGVFHGAAILSYLWFFLCLDDVTPENGATWIVPGSHHLGTAPEPESCGVWKGDELSNFPSRMQLCGRAGDILVLNPVTIHTSGRNSTSKPRRLLNVGLCNAVVPPLLNHWAIAGASIQQRATPRLRSLLGGDRKQLPDTFNALPRDHQTAPHIDSESEVLR